MNSDTLKLGFVSLDGHGHEFARLINGPESKVEGARVVAAMPVPTVMISKEKLEEKTAKTRDFGVEIVDTPEGLADKVDGILILHDDGSKHLELVRMFVDKGKPLFVDKPLEASAEKARELVRLCRSKNCPMFTASSQRFSVEMQKTLANEAGGRIMSAMAYCPWNQSPTMPGWIYYAIHAVEPLYALMGRGCREVRSVSGNDGPVAIGRWNDGRLGIARAISRAEEHAYGFTAWRENAHEVVTNDISIIYDRLLRTIKSFMETGVPPVDAEESVEVIAFMEAANASMENDGSPVLL